MNDPTPPILPTSEWGLAVGQGVERVEDERLLRGQGVFVDDVRLPEALHAVILRSSVAHGRVLGVDGSAARAMPGVRAVTW